MSSVDLCALRQKKYQFHHVKARWFLYRKLQTRRLSSVFTNQQKNRKILVLTLNIVEAWKFTTLPWREAQALPCGWSWHDGRALSSTSCNLSRAARSFESSYPCAALSSNLSQVTRRCYPAATEYLECLYIHSSSLWRGVDLAPQLFVMLCWQQTILAYCSNLWIDLCFAQVKDRAKNSYLWRTIQARRIQPQLGPLSFSYSSHCEQGNLPQYN